MRPLPFPSLTKKPSSPFQPAGTFGKEIAIHVEINFAGSDLGRLNAVAIEIDHERIGNMQTLKAGADAIKKLAKQLNKLSGKLNTIRPTPC